MAWFLQRLPRGISTACTLILRTDSGSVRVVLPLLLTGFQDVLDSGTRILSTHVGPLGHDPFCPRLSCTTNCVVLSRGSWRVSSSHCSCTLLKASLSLR